MKLGTKRVKDTAWHIIRIQIYYTSSLLKEQRSPWHKHEVGLKEKRKKVPHTERATDTKSSSWNIACCCVPGPVSQRWVVRLQEAHSPAEGANKQLPIRIHMYKARK